jgi:hypothetical protein
MGPVYAVGLTLNFVYIIASRQVGCQCPFQNFFQISVGKGQKRYQTLQKRPSGVWMKPVLLFVLDLWYNFLSFQHNAKQRSIPAAVPGIAVRRLPVSSGYNRKRRNCA